MSLFVPLQERESVCKKLDKFCRKRDVAIKEGKVSTHLKSQSPLLVSCLFFMISWHCIMLPIYDSVVWLCILLTGWQWDRRAELCDWDVGGTGPVYPGVHLRVSVTDHADRGGQGKSYTLTRILIQLKQFLSYSYVLHV